MAAKDLSSIERLMSDMHDDLYYKVWAQDWAYETFLEWRDFWSEQQKKYDFPDLPPRAGKSENPETPLPPTKLELADPEPEQEKKGELLSLEETAEPRECKSEPETEPPSPRHCPIIRPREESEEEDDEEEEAELPTKRLRVCEPEPEPKTPEPEPKTPEPIAPKPQKRPRDEERELMAHEAKKMRKIMGDLTKLAADTFLYFAGRKHEAQPPQENGDGSESDDDEPSFNLAKSTLADVEGYNHELDLSSSSDSDSDN